MKKRKPSEGKPKEVAVEEDTGSDEEQEEPDAETDEVAPEGQDAAEDEALEPDPLQEALNEAEENKDRWVRLAAEFENYKKRTAREFEALVRSASESVIRDLLPVLDAVGRALDHTDDGSTDSEGYQEGVKMIMEQFPKVLHDRGLSEIEAVGQPFDPHFHEALMQVESEDYDAGIVAEVVERGYSLGDKVIRHAKVVVSRGRPEMVREESQDREETEG
ncbi:MAG: nucleotide exchange factor GrpE [Candidatus Latescibacteria bacterium]|jgi:molecular chaperone GrpE|nr:nucleotide exchange factor GrpE [Candidatus Latescibacterota bacterium]